jgi:hypothetical protein
LPTVSVIALVSTSLALPVTASVVRGFFGLTGALVVAGISAGAATGGGAIGATVVAGAGGAAIGVLVSCPRESTGAANSAQTAIFKIVFFIFNFGLIFCPAI